MRFILLIVFISFATFTKCETFSSIDELKNLYTNHKRLINELDSLIINIKYNVENFKSKLRFFKDEKYYMNKNMDYYIENPLNQFILIKSLSHDIETIQLTLDQTLKNFTKNVEDVKLPMSDLQGTVEGFYRLQFTYKLKTKDLSKGYIEDEKYRSSLKVDDLYVIGKNMIQFNATYAEEYLNLALEKNEESKEINTYEILETLLTCYIKNNKYNDALATLNKMEKLKPENKDLFEKIIENELNITVDNIAEVTNDDNDLSGSHSTPFKNQMIFAQACRGERTQSSAVQSKLYCFMQSNTPFTKIAPFKVEIANFNPYVVIFHEILSDAEIKIFKELSQEKLSRAHVMTTNSSNTISTVRVAKLSWHFDHEHEILKTLSKRVADMSGLNMETAEGWQVQNYGIGGHYIPHQDFAHKGQTFNLNTGNRIATTLFYLSDVDKGGATVFPLLRLYIPAKKGTAAFWYNLSTSGEREYNTLHGACPVIVGRKWVSNKWLHEYGQERTRPCELEPRPTDEEYYNKEFIL